MANKDYPRPKEAPVPDGSCCLVCGRKIPLTTSHIIPKHIIYRLPNFQRRWIDYNGINIMYLCANHHTLYDRGRLHEDEDLGKEAVLRIYPTLHAKYLELMSHIAGHKISKDGMKKLEQFIKLHTYE